MNKDCFKKNQDIKHIYGAKNKSCTYLWDIMFYYMCILHNILLQHVLLHVYIVYYFKSG